MAAAARKDDGDGELLTVAEVADRMRVREKTVYAWIEDEEIDAIDVSARGARPAWRVSERALAKFKAERSTL
jgi:excisionase family DNA binding protein